jgi:hypothetical protein
MKTACIRGVLVGVFAALCISCVLACPQADCQSNPNAPAKMMESIVISKAGAKSDCTECGPRIIELSPDGAYIARLRTDFDQKG